MKRRVGHVGGGDSGMRQATCKHLQDRLYSLDSLVLSHPRRKNETVRQARKALWAKANYFDVGMNAGA